MAVESARLRCGVAFLGMMVMVIGPTPVDEAAARRLPEATEGAAGRALIPFTVMMAARIGELVGMNTGLALAACAGDMDKTPAKRAMLRLGVSAAVLIRSV